MVCWLLARVTGLEPATSGVTGRRSNQLSYTRSSEGVRVGWRRMGVKCVAGVFDYGGAVQPVREDPRHRDPAGGL